MRVDVLTSGIWQTTSFVRSQTLRSRRHQISGEPEQLPRTPIRDVAPTPSRRRDGSFSAALADAVARGDARAARYLEDAREFDSRWYVPRPGGHRWPARLEPLADGARASLAGIAVHALALPGHSPDGLGLVVEEAGVLLAGDHLSPCEIPFVDDLSAYRATLRRLRDVLGEVREVIPGHGPRLTAAEADAIARADLDYLDRLADAGARGDAAAAEAVPLPRAADVVGMRAHHLENCALLTSPPGSRRP